MASKKTKRPSAAAASNKKTAETVAKLSSAAKATGKAAASNMAGSFGSVIPFASFQPEIPTNFSSMETMMSTTKNQYEKLTADATAAGRQSYEALTKSNATFAKGFEQISKTLAGIVQDTTAKNTEAFKQLMACKTINEFAEVQNRIAQNNFDAMMTNATKISELAIRVSTEALEPLNDQFSKTIKKASENLAA
jgi:phasin family protein